MKKTYMIPTLQVVKIQTNQLLIQASEQYSGQDIQARGAGFSANDDWED